MIPRLFALCAAVLSCMLPATVATASEDTVGDLRRIEERGLRGLPPFRVQQLLQEPQEKALKTEISFTKSWVAAQPTPKKSKDLECLAEALYFEARGEPVRGQFAVAEVILNRVKSARFPSNVCNVVNQGTGRLYQCQFTYTCDGLSEKISEPAAYRQVEKVAFAALENKAPELTEGATHYHTTAVRPRWSRVYTRTTKIGVHIFYRHNFRTASN